MPGAEINAKELRFSPWVDSENGHLLKLAKSLKMNKKFEKSY